MLFRVFLSVLYISSTFAGTDPKCLAEFANLRVEPAAGGARIVYKVPESMKNAKGDFVAAIRLFKKEKLEKAKTENSPWQRTPVEKPEIEFFRFGNTDFLVTSMANGVLTLRHPRDPDFVLFGAYKDDAAKPAANVAGKDMGRQIIVTLYIGPAEREYLRAHWGDK